MCFILWEEFGLRDFIYSSVHPIELGLRDMSYPTFHQPIASNQGLIRYVQSPYFQTLFTHSFHLVVVGEEEFRKCRDSQP